MLKGLVPVPENYWETYKKRVYARNMAFHWRIDGDLVFLQLASLKYRREVPITLEDFKATYYLSSLEAQYAYPVIFQMGANSGPYVMAPLDGQVVAVKKLSPKTMEVCVPIWAEWSFDRMVADDYENVAYNPRSKVHFFKGQLVFAESPNPFVPGPRKKSKKRPSQSEVW